MIDVLQEPYYVLFQPFVVRKSKKSVLYTRGGYNGCLVSLAEVTIMFYGHVFQDSLIGACQIVSLT